MHECHTVYNRDTFGQTDNFTELTYT